MKLFQTDKKTDLRAIDRKTNKHKKTYIPIISLSLQGKTNTTMKTGWIFAILTPVMASFPSSISALLYLTLANTCICMIKKSKSDIVAKADVRTLKPVMASLPHNQGT